MGICEMCLVEVSDGAGMTRNDVTELFHCMADDELLPMKCRARRKDTAAVGFIGLKFAKFLNYDYGNLQDFVASILDSSVPNDEDVYDFHGWKILVKRI